MNHCGRVICKHVLSINTTTVTTNTTTNMGMDTDSQVWEYCEPLFSKHEQCDDWQGDLAMSDDEPAEVALYTRNGTKFSQHFTKLCTNGWCRKRFKKYQHSDKTVLTGCTAMPSSDNPFCKEHMEAEMPVILSNRVTTQTRKRLWTYGQKSQGYGMKLPKDSIFTVESVLNARKNKNKIEFLVKFAGFPFQEACWEPVTSRPTFIVEHYSVKTNLGTPLPTPTVKKTVKNGSGTEIFQHLEWKTSGLDSKALKLRDGESLFDIDQDKLEQDEILSTCNTRKVRDKRDRRHTAGVLISATPCGRIPHVDELFGCETLQQVHGSNIEFLGNLNLEIRAKFRVLLFDDMCHLKPHSEKTQVANYNEVTKMFADLPKAVDKFHFQRHNTTATLYQ